jgi:hypothetical protein
MWFGSSDVSNSGATGESRQAQQKRNQMQQQQQRAAGQLLLHLNDVM